MLALLVSGPEAQAHHILRSARQTGQLPNVYHDFSQPNAVPQTEEQLTPSESRGESGHGSSSSRETGRIYSNTFPNTGASGWKPASVEPSDNGGGAWSSSTAENILYALTTRSDYEGSALLARIRMGEDWGDVAMDVLRGQQFELDGMNVQTLTEDDDASPDPDNNWLSMSFDRDVYKRVGHVFNEHSSPGTMHNIMTGVRFGNLPFSSSLRCNQNPSGVQEMQHRNLFLPIWAIPPIGGAVDSLDPFGAIYASLEQLQTNGMEAEEITGSHAFLGALDSQEAFDRAPVLSQQIARIIHSIRAGKAKTTFTHYALMHWYWSNWRWMLNPKPETYCHIPSHGRPTPYQLFCSHPRVFDFLAQPSLRDLMCQSENPDVRWLSEGAATIECEWELSIQEAMCANIVTGESELSLAARAQIERTGVWSFGPSIRPYLKNADYYIKIR